MLRREEIQIVGEIGKAEELLASIPLIFRGCDSRAVAQQRTSSGRIIFFAATRVI